jgi:hypothetical protein
MSLQSHIHVITIFVARGQQEIKLEFNTDRATGLMIKERAGGSANDGLYRKVDGHVVEIADDEVVHLKEHEHFTLVPNGRVS